MKGRNKTSIKESLTNGNKGLELERNAHQFLWDHGYLVFPRLKIYATRYKTSGTLEKLDVTDLDCYGILFGEYSTMCNQPEKLQVK